jgi:putative ABC transport system permease protein
LPASRRSAFCSRRFEFGLRFALGADRAQVLTSVLQNALLVALCGIGVGVALSLALVRVLGSLFGQLPAFDPLSYAVAVFVVLMVAALASLLPAARAAQTDPSTALRSE